MIEVMIANSNKMLSRIYCNFFSKEKDIHIVSYTDDGIQTIVEYNKNKPDVLILDSDLPRLNGMDVIDYLSIDLEERKKCNILLVSNECLKPVNISNTSKIYKIFTNPVNYESVIETIKEIPSNSYKEFNEKNIRTLLLKLNFNLHSYGTTYLIYAIDEAYKNPDLIANISKLYELVGEKVFLPPETVRGKIRNSMETMLRITSDDEIKRVLPFYHNSKRLTPKYLITLIVDYFT